MCESEILYKKIFDLVQYTPQKMPVIQWTQARKMFYFIANKT